MTADHGMTAIDRAPRTAVLTATAAVGVAVVLAGGVLLRESTFDLPVVRALNTLHVGATAALGDAVYLALSPIPAILSLIVIVVLLTIVHRGAGAASTIAATVAITWLPSAVVKAVIARPRPDVAALPHPPAVLTDASYPSGHTVFVASLVIAAVLVARSRRGKRIWAVVGVAVLLVLVFSVLSDGVHYPSDVVASIVWAAAIAPLVAVVWMRSVVPRVPLLRPRARVGSS